MIYNKNMASDIIIVAMKQGKWHYNCHNEANLESASKHKAHQEESKAMLFTGVSKRLIFRFSTRAGNGWLLLRTPGYKLMAGKIR